MGNSILSLNWLKNNNKMYKLPGPAVRPSRMGQDRFLVLCETDQDPGRQEIA